MKPKKILTFSYDDGVTQDIRLAALFHKYGMKATFNLNSALLGREGELLREGVQVRHDKVAPRDVRAIYEGHEVAAHTLTHPTLTHLTDDGEIIRQVEEDRLRLSELCGYEVVGFAYPGGRPNHSTHVAKLIQENTGIRYCRTTISSYDFGRQENLYEFRPTVYHHAEWDRMLELGEEFLARTPETTEVFYVWGHAYEFDIRNEWDRFEEFLSMMAGRPDIAYLTNKEALLFSEVE